MHTPATRLTIGRATRRRKVHLGRPVAPLQETPLLAYSRRHGEHQSKLDVLAIAIGFLTKR
eukprot:7261076-Heterocapsa_arctica.AAC.1